ncbi:MAG: type III-A CRISPR-associated RAMP protein Csm5 [Candidatus Aminicenantes bacterium]|nr:type III-A CRISPR-associated RAMP protein Csm5 [Candidatus Aminicenantes bacterium]
MKARVRTLSPVHIGSGETISPLEYFVDSGNGRFCLLNMNSLLNDVGFNRYRDVFIKEAGLTRNIRKIIPDESLLRKHILYSIPITGEARQSNYMEVKSFINSGNRPYLPGSSIKGAIVSALMYFALKELYKNSETRSEIINALNSGSYGRETDSKNNYEQLLNRVYDYLADNQENGPAQGKFTNLLDVSDSNYLSPEQSLQIEACKVEGSRKKSEIPIRYETIKEGIEVDIEITRKRCKYSEKKILEICHDFYQKVAKKDAINLPGEPYLIRVGQGATAFSTSFLLLAEELGIRNYPVKPPRTRKRLLDGALKKSLGFIQVKLL